MLKILKLTFNKHIEQYKKSSFIDLFSILFLHVFISWNGIQFLFYPIHFDYLIDITSIAQNIAIIEQTQALYIPLYLFCIITGFIIIYFIKNYMEIEMYCYNNNIVLSFKHHFIHLINFSVPAFFNNIFIVFVLATVYFLLMILYFLLISFNINIPLSFDWLVKFSIYYFFTGIVMFTIISTDFILPEILRSNTYKDGMNKFHLYFQENKRKVFFFYLFKLLCVITNIIIFIFFLHYFIPTTILTLPLSTSLSSSLILILTIFSGVVLSLLINSVIVLFLNIFCTNLFDVLFDDYKKKSYTHIS